MKYKLKLDYTEEELKELRELRENHDSPMYATRQIADIVNGSDKLKNLQIKYAGIDYEDEFDFMADINNVVMGTAIFPEPKKYYVKLSKIVYPYYLVQTNDGMGLVSYLGSGYKEEFTEQEIKAIDPRYMAFAVPVEADDEL